MILEFDNNPALSPDERLQSLKENVQLALNEQSDSNQQLYRTLLKAFGVDLSKLRNDFTSITERLEEQAKQLAESITQTLVRLSNVEDAVEALEVLPGQIATIQADIESIGTRLTTLQADIESIGTRLTTLETDYTGLAGRVGTLETNYTDLEARVRALEGNSTP